MSFGKTGAKLGIAWCLFAASAAAQADTVKLVKGGTVTAKVREETDQAVTYNIYRTGIARAQYGTETVDRKNVKSLVKDAHPHRSFWRRA